MNKTKEKKKVYNEEGVYRSRKLPNWLYLYCNMYMNTSAVDKLVMTICGLPPIPNLTLCIVWYARWSLSGVLAVKYKLWCSHE